MQPCPCYPLRVGPPDFPTSHFAVGGCFSRNNSCTMCQWQEQQVGCTDSCFSFSSELGLLPIGLRKCELPYHLYLPSHWNHLQLCTVWLVVASALVVSEGIYHSLFFWKPLTLWHMIRHQQGQVKPQVHLVGSAACVVQRNTWKRLKKSLKENSKVSRVPIPFHHKISPHM